MPDIQGHDYLLSANIGWDFYNHISLLWSYGTVIEVDMNSSSEKNTFRI